ncbi:lytic murein transglycosylase B [Acidihalobacter aeolianus]|uniref:lytic murein transglycosylase B n=1 Tax=Acidihalobacter aeolianus TaxID=2792603 RepID=UPI0009F16ADB|nr:lytic murein transglycosylase B [Acidihalobacter aeolianus]
MNCLSPVPASRRPGRRLAALLTLLAVCLPAARAADDTFAHRPQVQAFIQQMVKQDKFDKAYLERLFADAQPLPAVISAMQRPAESLPWYRYRPIFLTEQRIREGVVFWRKHQAALARAQRAYGVPPQVITAIIGVESYYGRHMGTFPVFSTLATLGFDYPPRADFFRQQLAQFLLLARDEGIDPLKPKGSYAGAMGQGQFMPGSYRAYAVDFDGNGGRDLWNDPVDAIGSIGNYLARHGWRADGFVAARARVGGTPKAALDAGVRPSLSSKALAAAGVRPAHALPKDHRYALISLQTRTDPEYWVTGQNFYVITRYNASALYAMAVYQLSEAIRDAYEHAKATEVANRHGS